MADTYNENEIVKLKHLNEFARQLNIKLDGGIDPKIDYPATIQTWNMRQTNGSNSFGTVTTDNLKLNLNAGTFNTETGSGLPFRLGGLSEYNVPGITITKSNDNFQVQHRSTNYGGPDHVQQGLRGLWDINFYVIGNGNIVAGDYFTVKVNVLGNATHNPYERTITFTFVEWQG